MKAARSRMGIEVVVVLLLAFQALSVFFLWSLNPASQTNETAFALLLAIDMVAFSMISYAYRATKGGEGVRPGWILAGSAMILVLTSVSLVL